MAKSTHSITYHYDFDGHDIAVTRRHYGTAYAKNGNVGNPTEYFLWDVAIDGEHYLRGCRSRSNAYETGRARILGTPYFDSDGRNVRRDRGIRSFYLVRDEMKANYNRKENKP